MPLVAVTVSEVKEVMQYQALEVHGCSGNLQTINLTPLPAKSLQLIIINRTNSQIHR